MQIFDVIIIGNGISGMATALELTKLDSNLRVAVVGSFNRPGSATVAAGAMLGCFSEVTTKTLASVHGRSMLEASFKASKKWSAWLAEINQDLSEDLRAHIQPGTFIVSNSAVAKHESEHVDAIVSALTEYREPFEKVRFDAIPGFKPIDHYRPCDSLFLPNEGSINPAKLLDAMTVVLEKKSVTFFNETVIDFSHASGKIQHVVTSGNTQLSADKVLLAAGAYSQAFLDKSPSLAEQIPRVFAGLGCSAIFRNTDMDCKIPLTSVIRSPNRSHACGIHAVPCDKEVDYVYMGASNTCLLSPSTEPRIRDVFYLLERAMEQINYDFHNKSLVGYKVGNRPVTMDTFPLIGKTSVDNLWVLTGTYRTGLQLSPIFAQRIAHDMLDKSSVHNELDLFRPERELIVNLSKQQAIDLYAKEAFGTGYEHSMVLPKIGWEHLIEQAIRKDIESIYDQLETEIGIYPDILCMLQQNKALVPIFKTYLQKQQHKIGLVAAA